MNRSTLILAALLLVPAAGHARGGPSLGIRWVSITPVEGSGANYYGAQARLWGDVLGLEGSLDRLYRSHNGTTIIDHPLMLSLLARPTSARQFSPFLLGGVAWYNTYFETTNPVTGVKYKNSDQNLGYHIGAGLEVFINDSVSIDGTWRRTWVEEVESKDAAAQNKKWDPSGSMWTIGLNLHF